jgi:hypothetical protein
MKMAKSLIIICAINSDNVVLHACWRLHDIEHLTYCVIGYSCVGIWKLVKMKQCSQIYILQQQFTSKHNVIASYMPSHMHLCNLHSMVPLPLLSLDYPNDVRNFRRRGC